MAPGIGMPIPVETQECIPSEFLASKERNVEVSPLCLAGFPFPFVYCPHLIHPSSTVRSLRPKLTLCFAVSSFRINSSGTQDLVLAWHPKTKSQSWPTATPVIPTSAGSSFNPLWEFPHASQETESGGNLMFENLTSSFPVSLKDGFQTQWKSRQNLPTPCSNIGPVFFPPHGWTRPLEHIRWGLELSFCPRNRPPKQRRQLEKDPGQQ